MKAMILAAGRGERMRPLTDNVPKPLLSVADKPLLQHMLEQLVNAGFNEIVINLAYLGQQISHYFGNGQAFGATIEYSYEGESALETAGGIINALPLLGHQPFLVVNGDIACNFPFASLTHKIFDLAHLVMIPNPAHHPCGDFHLQSDGLLSIKHPDTLTFSGIGLYKPALFAGIAPGKSKLGPLLRKYIHQQRISAELHNGFWMDIGTPQRLQALEAFYRNQ